MSDLARLAADLARALGAERVLVVGEQPPRGLAEACGPGVRVEVEATIEATADSAGADCLLLGDGLLETATEPAAALTALERALETAAGALITVADRDLLASEEERAGARWTASELTAALAEHGLEPAWLGLTDSHGSLGRRAGLACALSRTRGPELGAALAAGPLGLGFDPVAASAAGAASARVCIASYEFVGPTLTGGIGTAYTSLAETLAAEGHAVTVLFTGWPDEAAEPFQHWVRHYREHGIELLRLPQPTASWIETGHRHAVRAYEVYRWLRDRDAEPFDVVHFPEVLGHGYYAVCAKRLGVALERTTLAIGTHSSTSWVLEANGTLFQALDDFADDFVERRCVELCDVLISPSAYMRDWMRSRGWRLPERNFVQQYARSEAVVRVDPAPPAPASGTTEVVFFGRLEPRKGVRVFCDALDLLTESRPRADCRVTFLGKRSSVDGLDAGEYIGERAGRWPWPVAVVDDLGQPAAIAHLRSPGRRITVVPSLADNSPNTVYEALALRIPLIASRVGGTAELIDARDLARTTFDPAIDLPEAEPSGPEALAELIAATIDSGELEPPRATVAADVCRAAHTRWHAGVASAPPAPAPAAPAESRLAVCALGDDEGRIAVTRRSLDAQTLAPAESIAAAVPAAARPTAERVLFLPAGARLRPDAVEVIERAAGSGGSELIAIAIAIEPDGDAAAVTRVPVGGPAIAGLLRRALGDAAFVVSVAALERLGGFDSAVDASDQAHHLLCRAAIAGIQIDVLPEPLAFGAPADSLAPMSIVEQPRRRSAIIDAYRAAPLELLGELPVLTQQLFATASDRERQFTDLYENRFGRLTLPIRRSVGRARRARRILRRGD